jgi:hypothetical protein
VVETAVVVVLILSSGKAALLLSRCCGIGGNPGKLLGALFGEMTHNSTFIAVDVGLVFGVDGGSIASSPRGGIGVAVVSIVVVVVGAVVVVVVVVVVPSGLRGSSVVVGVVGAIILGRGIVESWGESSRGVIAILLIMVGSILVHHSSLAVLVGLMQLSFHLNG